MRGPVVYYIDFVLFPLIALVMMALYCRSMYFVSGAVTGVFLFSFAEYWIHRIALHKWFFHNHHEEHHVNPKAYVIFPIWFTPAVFILFFSLFPISIFTGLVIGYCWFLVWHHTLHHTDYLYKYSVWISKYSVWHLKHHNDETVNFGITMNLWDWLFGTYR